MQNLPLYIVSFTLLSLQVWGVKGGTVTLPAGVGSPQDIVNANPAGTTYIIASGIHQYFTLQPKDNDVYIGQPGAILTGGRLLSDWQYNGKLYYVTNQTQHGQQSGQCIPDRNCAPPEDLFMDRNPLIHVMNLSVVTTGCYFFDYTAHIIYMFDNPKGHTMETSVTRAAFNGNSQNVTIQNVYVEMYAIPAQMGAIGDQYPGNGWKIQNCTVTLCHGTGINVASYGQILNNIVTLNGQKGIGGGGDYVVAEGNVISFNNYAGFNPGWEAGGSKFAFTRYLVVRNNHSFNNTGDGLWTDINNIFTLYEGNIVEYNQQNGISHEISYNATFRNNYLRFNGYAFDTWLWGSQILIQNSQNVQVYNNTVILGTAGNGISIIYQNRGNGTYGPWIPLNNFISDNQVYYLANHGQSGAVSDTTPEHPFYNSLTFDGNHYHVPDANGVFWGWNNAAVNFQDFKAGNGAKGQEPTGTLDTNNSPPPPPRVTTRHSFEQASKLRLN